MQYILNHKLSVSSPNNLQFFIDIKYQFPVAEGFEHASAPATASNLGRSSPSLLKLMQQKMKHEMVLLRSVKRMEAPKLALALLVGFCIGVFACSISMTVSTDKPHSSSNNEHQISSSLQISGRAHHGATRTNQTPSPWIMPNSPPTGQIKDRKADTDGGIVQPKADCDLSNPRTDVCELEGSVRVQGSSSSVILVSERQFWKGKDSWLIKPYARKFDGGAMKHIRPVVVKLMSEGAVDGAVPRCGINHSVPAVVFTLGGYTGNYYHDFTDILVPLFITSNQFAGEVQFLVETKNFWWLSKYEQILKRLSRYEIIFFNDDDEDRSVHCFPRVIVGLHSHKAMSIDPARAPNGVSMVDFARLMRNAYSLERDSPFRPEEEKGGGEEEKGKKKKKPRLLIIPRYGTRRFTNLEEIVRAAKEAEFEVVVAEAKKGSQVGDVARVVNSCDVMVGVHGAGLTNFVFLPTGAVIIQIVPFGRLENISRSCFGYPSDDARLHYLEYSIGEEESSLRELYPSNHPVFTDPKSIHRLGWSKMGEVYLDKQNVKLDVQRFKPLLLKARQLLLHQ